MSLTLTPTFHSVSIDWTPDDAAGEATAVRFRLAGETSWRSAQPLWYDSRTPGYRGSIVELLPGSQYEIELETSEGVNETGDVETWNESFPVAETVYLQDSSSETLTINRSGSESGYILYTGWGGKRPTIDVRDLEDYCVDIASGSSHIILRKLIIRGASADGIYLRGTCHDIVIEDCEFIEWGTAEANGGEDALDDAGIGNDGGGCYRIIIQRSEFHEPRGGATSWADGQPGGPQAIRLTDSAGNNVIRYNDIYSNFEHYFKSGLRGGTAAGTLGFPGRDSDIYENFIANVWDSAIEANGGGLNVRIYRNYMEDSYMMITARPVSIGPMYLFRNVAGRSRKFHTTDDSDNYGRGVFFNMGNVGAFGTSRVYVFHNTALQPDPAPGKDDQLGVAGGIIADGLVFQVVARNNVWSRHDGSGSVFTDGGTNSCTNDLDWDLYNGSLGNNCASPGHELDGGIALGNSAWPEFDSDNWWDGRSGIFALADEGLDAGTVLLNFNDDSDGFPDMGAYQSEAPAMIFGIKAGKKKHTGSLKRTVRTDRKKAISS